LEPQNYEPVEQPAIDVMPVMTQEVKAKKPIMTVAIVALSVIALGALGFGGYIYYKNTQNGSVSAGQATEEEKTDNKISFKTDYAIYPDWIIASVKNNSNKIIVDPTVNISYIDGDGVKQGGENLEIEPGVLAPGKTGIIKIAIDGAPTAIKVAVGKYNVDDGTYYSDWEVIPDSENKLGEYGGGLILKNTGNKTMIAPSVYAVLFDKQGKAVSVCAGMIAESILAPGETAKSSVSMQPPSVMSSAKFEPGVYELSARSIFK